MQSDTVSTYPGIEYATSSLKFGCGDEQFLPNPTQYINCQSKSVRYSKKQKLIETILILLSLTPYNDPEYCIILEFEDSYVRSLRSEFVCFLTT